MKNRETYINISNVVNTSKNFKVLLINNEYTENTKIIIYSNNNDFIKNYALNINNIDDIGLTDINLITEILKNYCENNGEAYNIFSELLETLTENIENEYPNIYNENYKLILYEYIKETEYLKNKLATDKNLSLERFIDEAWENIRIILDKVTDKEINPKKLGKSDLSEYLAKYLNLKYGLILRSNVNTPHLLNPDNNCYELTNTETLLSILANDFGHNTISMKEVIKALDYIDNRPKPKYNIIRFDNCVYDMAKHEVIKLTSPQLPYYDIYFNYNPKAKGELIREFLYSSLNEMQVQGLLELIGYLFTVGNKENIIICFIGKGGSGKSVLSNILRHLFKRVSNLPIHNLNKEHELMALEDNLLNICNDTDNKKIKDNGTFKQLTGGDSLHINPKYRQPYIMPPEEVPYFIIVGNQFPQFENLEIPIIERLMLIEFKKGFRNTKAQKKNLYDDIIADDDNIEWLIYNSLKAYKEIAINNKSFTLKKTTKENLDLYNKHTNPLKWIVKRLIEFDSSLLIENDFDENSLNNYNHYISVDDLKQSITDYAEKEGLDITNENKGISTNKLTNTIKSAFNLWSLNDNYNYDYKPLRKREKGNRYYVYPNVKYKDK
ncbi:MAG: hypothetical protein IKH85_00855 [Methanobrevibacter sp.]|uniref:DUF5906 domain-containing protein n=1 Tax=Methanobrevibacter sp. TaxID=66852 RepID=UPI0025EE728C|nr:DUF5906 domain-containing protein [Methanobrevibacter sp.]MBR6992604.1 hypothetical protein [Methanobrevibacter sp.]